jgi:SAM-dependent methyltransferase
MAAFDHLLVNRFLMSEIDARALTTGFELGLLDRLSERGPATLPTLSRELRIHPVGLDALVSMLETNAVIARSGDAIELTTVFSRALAFRDLMEVRIAFADFVWPDIHALFTPLLNDVQGFMARSRVFELFRYDRCLNVTEENVAAARAWTRFTTCLTKYESTVILDEVDMTSVVELVDLGGNTGEFALRICRRQPKVSAIVVDLPVVCNLGREHIARTARPSEAGRIQFQACDMRCEPLPGGADLVSFKSVLHDWPDQEAVRLLRRACEIVRPGGRVMIFERSPLDLRGRPVSYAMAPDLVFLHFLRPADLYLKTLAELGFVDATYQRIVLEVGFHLIVARRRI